MHGTVMVLPRDGLKDAAGKSLHYDKIYYIGENDLYVPKDEQGKYKTYETVGESYADTTEVMPMMRSESRTDDTSGLVTMIASSA